MTSPLIKEFNYYLANQDELVAKYRDRFVVIKGGQVIGIHDSELQAFKVTAKDHERGTFLIQHVSPGELEYTQSFHSRVAFS